MIPVPVIARLLCTNARQAELGADAGGGYLAPLRAPGRFRPRDGCAIASRSQARP